MAILKNSQTPAVYVASGIERKCIHLTGISTAVVSFKDGPYKDPMPFHTHPHEQISYVAKGDLYVFIGDEKHRISEGDLFSVSPDIPHTVQILSSTAILIDSFVPVREDYL